MTKFEGAVAFATAKPDHATFTGQRFVYRDPKTIPPRPWAYAKHYLMGAASATIAPAGLGKSSLALIEAVLMAAGIPLLDQPVRRPFRVAYWNGEEPRDELERRVAAILLAFAGSIKPADIEERLWLIAADDPDAKILFATVERGGLVIRKPNVDAVEGFIAENGIEIFIADPLVKTHQINENDNVQINAVADLWSGIAARHRCAVELVHHTRKPAPGRRDEITTADARGAVALEGAVRSMRVLNAMTPDEAPKAQVKVAHCRSYFRAINGKANYAPPPENSTWFQLVGISLDNANYGEKLEADSVAVVKPWKWPEPMQLTPDSKIAIQKRIREGEWRADSQAKAWAGHVVAEVLALDLDPAEPEERKAVKAQVRGILKEATKAGWLRKVTRKDATRQNREFIEAGNELL